MQHRFSSSLLALAVAGGLALTACGSDTKTLSTTPADGSTVDTATVTSDSAAPAADVSLAGICPDEIKVQTDWWPEAEHGFLYNMIGAGFTSDAAGYKVTGPLMAGSVDTGLKLTVLSGGGAAGFQSDTQLMYADKSILLGFVYTDEAIQNSEKFPTVAIESGYEKNPQMIMWDPATYPDVTGIKDIGTQKINVRYFGGAAYMDFLTSTGILSKDQVDGSYQGDPSLFVADEGKAAQQGFGSAEPYAYEKEIKDWLKPVKYEYINDVGWKNYAESIATLPENITKYGDCFKKLVPIIQQSAVDYITDPTNGNAVLLDAVKKFGDAGSGWVYSEGTAAYAVDTIKKDGLVANGTDGVMGSFDTARVDDLIAKAIPVYTAQDSPPKAGLKAADIVTNDFIDANIHL